MVTSYKTAAAIHTVLQRHLTDEQITLVLLDLSNVEGNTSFHDTMKRIAVFHDEHIKRKKR